MNPVPAFLTVEAAAFGAAAATHAGLLARGYEHLQASIAEGVIAAVLLLGLAAGALAPRSSRVVALGAQAFALFGTLVGVTMIAIGVGPQSRFDVALHAGFIALLVNGLTIVARARRGVPS